jgi:Small metal-binding protein
MKLNTVAVALIVGALSVFGVGISYAGEHENHVAQALTQAQEAVDAGQKGMASNVVAAHAEQALVHAQQAGKAKADTHITEAETHLNQAIEHGNKGQANTATDHAKEAVRHLELAYKGTTVK